MERMGMVRSVLLCDGDLGSPTLLPDRHCLGLLQIHKLKIVQPPVGSQFLHQVIVGADIADGSAFQDHNAIGAPDGGQTVRDHHYRDRKSTRLNSSHVAISYAVFCLKKKIKS